MLDSDGKEVISGTDEGVKKLSSETYDFLYSIRERDEDTGDFLKFILENTAQDFNVGYSGLLGSKIGPFDVDNILVVKEKYVDLVPDESEKIFLKGKTRCEVCNNNADNRKIFINDADFWNRTSDYMREKIRHYWKTESNESIIAMTYNKWNITREISRAVLEKEFGHKVSDGVNTNFYREYSYSMISGLGDSVWPGLETSRVTSLLNSNLNGVFEQIIADRNDYFLKSDAEKMFRKAGIEEISWMFSRNYLTSLCRYDFLCDITLKNSFSSCFNRYPKESVKLLCGKNIEEDRRNLVLAAFQDILKKKMEEDDLSWLI